MSTENTTITADENKQPAAESAPESQSSPTKKSSSRVAVGVAAASGTALLAVSMIGIAPVVIASAAGYLAYCGMTGQDKSDNSAQTATINT
jgi:hypothetical protein